MSTSKIRIVVVPVALDISGHSARLVGYRPDGNWLSVGYSTGSTASALASDLFRGRGPHLARSSYLPAVTPEAATFVEDLGGRQVVLVYTAPVPLTAPLTNGEALSSRESPDAHHWVGLTPNIDAERRNSMSDAEWTTVVDKAMDELDPVARAVLEHWRQQVEETTAGMEMLPRYFTVAQLRAVYEAIWQISPDAGNFHRWIKTTNAGVCTDVEERSVAQARDDVAHMIFQESGWPATAGPPRLADALGGMVGTSPTAVANLAAAVAPPLAAVGAVAGGTVAFQTAKTRGPRAQWLRRTEEKRIVLKELYAPRPLWQQAGIAAHPGGH